MLLIPCAQLVSVALKTRVHTFRLPFAVIGHLADDWVNSGRASLLSVRKYCTFAGLMLPALFLLAFAFVTHLYTAIL